MRRKRTAAWLGYVIAVMSSLAALGLTLLLLPVISRTIVVLFLAAVSATTWYGGARAGGLAIVLSMVLVQTVVMPMYVFADTFASRVVPLWTFAGVALFIVWLIARARESERVAIEANRAKAEFLASMSHELRTPLNAIAGYTDLLDMGIHGELTETQRDTIRRVRRNQTQLHGLVEQILNFARIESGHVELRPQDLAVDSLLSRVSELVAPQLQAKRLTFGYQACDGRLTAWCDAERVEQIIVNLLSNAVKYTPQGGSVTISVECDERELGILVSDTGLGIPADKLGDVFEPFVQLRAPNGLKADGIGLGLAISRDLARAMGGDVTATSTVGAGSTFTLRLPRHRPAVQPYPVPGPASASASGLTPLR